MELPGCQVDSQRLCGDWCQEEVSLASGGRTKEEQETGTSPSQVSRWCKSIYRYPSLGSGLDYLSETVRNLSETRAQWETHLILAFP